MNEYSRTAIEQGQPSAPAANPDTPHVTGPDQPGSPRRLWLWVLLLVLLGIGGYYFSSRTKKSQTPAAPTTGNATKQAGGASGGRTRGAGGVPPVVAVKAVKGNIGVYFSGLGAITPIYTVSVKSRVDGQLMQVAYREGQMIRAGQPLLEIDPRPFQVQLETAEGQLSRDQATLENAKTDLTRYQQLITRRAVPEQTLATQKSLVAQTQGTLKTDQAAIDSAKLNLTYCHITAPISGRLGLRLVDPGNYVQAASSTPLAVITQIDPISVIFTLPEDQLAQVVEKTSSGVKLHVDAFNRDLSKRLSSGILSTIDNQIDQTTGTVKLRATFPNPGGKLFPNQFVNARLLVEEKRGVVLLQNAAIQRNAQSTYVFLVKPDQTVTVRQVVLGTTDGDNTEVKSGLAPGDVAVMTGVDKLQEGSKVSVHMADAQGNVEKQRSPKGQGIAGGRTKQEGE